MNIEQKAKAYDEALKWMRELYPGLHGATKEDAEHYFPELRESKNERVRNGLIGVVSDITGGWPFEKHKITKKEAITYLEKQKDAFENGRQFEIMQEQARQELEWQGEKQEDHFRDDTKKVEQKPEDDKAFKEWIDDWWKHNKVNNPDSYDKGDEIQFDEKGFKNFCRGIRNMYANQKTSEWSEEDEKMKTNAVLSLMYLIEECPNADFIDSVKKEIAWLKSLRPQPQQNMSIGFMLYLDEHRPDGKMCLSNAECNEIETAFKNQSWDTILRYIEKYQPHWKPSEEQLNALNFAITYFMHETNYKNPAELRELYEQLKKLM